MQVDMKKIFLIAVILSLPLLGQEKEHEINSQVKELTDFHEVIYQIWHTGWPEKNIKFLRSLSPDVENGFEKIKSAELPGILRDKKMKWEEGIKKFSVCVDEYKNTAVKNDSVGLLNAAEKLHFQYEMLVRVIRPVLKEADAFHQVLYMLYHYYTPEYNFIKIKESAAELQNKMEDLNKAKLSKRMEDREKAFNDARMELEIAIKKFTETVKTGDNKKAITSAVELVHSKYGELEKVFD
jgi:hypothetical protein